MTAIQTGAALILALILLLIGAWLRSRSRTLTKVFAPASLVAGVLGLLAGPEVLGALVTALGGAEAPLATGAFPAWVTRVWSNLPGLMINVVFAGLFLGAAIPGPRRIWRLAGPQVAFGQTIAWGQYVVGLALALAVLTPVFGLPYASGALIEIGFEGGHGTAAGLTEVFSNFGFEDGLDLALGLATVGVVGAVVIGMALVNWAARRGHIQPTLEPAADVGEVLVASSGIDAAAEGLDRDPAQGRLMPGAEVIEPMTFIAGFIGGAILLGWLLLQALMLIENALWADTGVLIIRYVPLFPFAMLGGIAIQVVLDRTGKGELLDRRIVVAVQGLALDLLITAAIATLSLVAIGRHLWPFVLLASAGTAWCLFCFIVLAPRYMGRWWFERGIADFGQSMGMTASGLLLLRVSDPAGRSPALASFGYKQLLFEPVVGGGLFTAAAIPLIVGFGPWLILVLTTALTAFWMGVGLLYFGRQRGS
ncbi:MAG: sodium/glutamate symporter [Phenylobacterium sp.]|uniref:sodium/glutamate symporter n=1 Tax=Phenylobacterium sp. TaxID=1871053 RepID=UPI00272F1C4F|nr:sodium/glutamate symporter [Phenylobacterium sp.]MDP2009009.1 sodium/glutamate symporter [Phenylobacterium sp.]